MSRSKFDPGVDSILTSAVGNRSFQRNNEADASTNLTIHAILGPSNERSNPFGAQGVQRFLFGRVRTGVCRCPFGFCIGIYAQVCLSCSESHAVRPVSIALDRRVFALCMSHCHDRHRKSVLIQALIPSNRWEPGTRKKSSGSGIDQHFPLRFRAYLPNVSKPFARNVRSSGLTQIRVEVSR